MSFTYGFYNSIDNDRLYDAIQVSKIFDGIIRDGVYETIGDAFIVQADPNQEPNLVIVGPGRAWFNHTWNENDGYLEIELPPPEMVVDRIDMVVIDVDERVQSRMNQILVVKGLPSNTPVNPTLINEPEHHQYPLCSIYRNANTPVVIQARITNMVGTTACPFVIGVLEILDANLLLLQWRSAWAEFLEQCGDELDEWQDVVKEDVRLFVLEFKRQCDDYLAQTAAWTTEQKDKFNDFLADFNAYTETNKQAWEEWVAELTDILDEETAGHLLLEINKINEYLTIQIQNDMKTAIYLMDRDFMQCKTTFPNENTIVETFPTGHTNTTTFLSNGNIDEAFRNPDGSYLAVKQTIFNSDGSITENVSNGEITEFFVSRPFGVGRYINTRYELEVSDSIAVPLNTITNVVNSSEMMDAIVADQVAFSHLLVTRSFEKAIKQNDVAKEKINGSDVAMKEMISRRWAYTITVPLFVTNIINNRVLLNYIFTDTTRRNRFTSNATLMNKLVTESTLKQLCIFAGTGGAYSNVKWVIKDRPHNDFPQYDIHSYAWMVMFNRIYDGATSQGTPGTATAEINFHPLNTDEPVYHWVYDKYGGSVTIETPIPVNIAGGAYAMVNGVQNDNGNPVSVTGMTYCVAF